MKRGLVFLILCLHVFTVRAEVLDVGIYTNQQISQAIITPAQGGYEVFADGNKITLLFPNDAIRIYASEGKVGLRTVDRDYGSFGKVVFVRTAWGNVFRIRPTQAEEHKYNDNLVATAKSGELRLINRVYLEHYVAGVVESESGSKQNTEYYKLQSIVCRTYALNNLRRHENEGFHLCDQVHCQVYHGQSRFAELIPPAVSGTKGLVVVDSNIDLVTAAFHSNCGGQTINAEDVWSKPVPYLQSVRDTFCLNGKHASWETRVPRQKWINYLQKRHGIHHPVTETEALHFNREHERNVYYASSDSGVHLKDIRSDWNLKSTYFMIEPADDYVLIRGRGFGHGVGMCQEGAMRMTELGFSYDEIIHYYYSNVHIIDLSVLDFFKEH